MSSFEGFMIEQAVKKDRRIDELELKARADAETIRCAVEVATERGAEILRLREQLAAQSAELVERVRKLPDIWRKRYENDSRRTDADVCADELEIALAAPSAAGGEKEPSEAQMFGGDLYSGIKP